MCLWVSVKFIAPTAAADSVRLAVTEPTEFGGGISTAVLLRYRAVR